MVVMENVDLELVQCVTGFAIGWCGILVKSGVFCLCTSFLSYEFCQSLLVLLIDKDKKSSSIYFQICLYSRCAQT